MADTPILIIYAHPDTKRTGNCCTILGEVQKGLVERGYAYETIDLYKDGFNPVLSAEEHYVSGGKDRAPETLAYQERFRKAEELVIIHPVWWGGMPAILKGFFDRLLTPGFGYQYVGGRPQKLFKGKRALVLSTSAGPWWWTCIVQGARAKKNLQRDILGFLGVRARVFVLTHAGRVDDPRRAVIERFVARALRRHFGAPRRAGS